VITGEEWNWHPYVLKELENYHSSERRTDSPSNVRVASELKAGKCKRASADKAEENANDFSGVKYFRFNERWAEGLASIEKAESSLNNLAHIRRRTAIGAQNSEYSTKRNRDGANRIAVTIPVSLRQLCTICSQTGSTHSGTIWLPAFHFCTYR